MKPRRSVEHAVLPLGEDRAHAERAADLLADDDAAERRRQHDGRPQAARRDRAMARPSASACCGMLQHERALQVAGAVQPGGQAEVALEQRAGPAEQIEKFDRGSRPQP